MGRGSSDELVGLGNPAGRGAHPPTPIEGTRWEREGSRLRAPLSSVRFACARLTPTEAEDVRARRGRERMTQRDSAEDGAGWGKGAVA